MSEPDGSLSDILDRLGEIADGRQRLTIADIRSALGNRSFGPFLFLPALLEISPIGGIPGLPTVLATIVALFGIQIACGRHHLWLPGFLERREVGAQRFGKGVDWLRSPARRIDGLIGRRLSWLTKRPILNLLGVLCIALAATVPFLELIPFASTLPMAAIAMIGLAIMARDGVLAIVAAALSLGTVYALARLVGGWG